MPEYRRARITGCTYFFTLVTHRRRPILTTPIGLDALGRAWRRVSSIRPFETVAVCLLPDHLHAVWTLPDGDADYSARWAAIKVLFTRRYGDLRGSDTTDRSLSRAARGERNLWQRRFWEHTIRDGDDLRKHIDYIHYNPVKHGYALRPTEWRWSTLRRYVRAGWYDPRWGECEPRDLAFDRTTGE
jgi:putative transposase